MGLNIPGLGLLKTVAKSHVKESIDLEQVAVENLRECRKGKCKVEQVDNFSYLLRSSLFKIINKLH